MTLWTPWLEVTITGFVYLVAILFFLLRLLKVKNLTFLDSLRPYAPYIAVVTLFSSYVCGLVAHLALAKLLALFSPELRYFSPRKIIQAHLRAPEYLTNSVGVSYTNFVLLRHLAIATWMLGISLSLWLDS